ncbi:MAG: geranylgeranyl reductase family protein [Thermodesulfobacteriota bacterium]
MGFDYDVIIVGAGPGGSTAARFCAQAGLKTFLIEKERMPRYKACGGCLSLKTVHLLGLDLTPVLETTIYGAKFTYRLKDSFSIESRQPVALMVMRDRFDQFLVKEALEMGAEIREGIRVVSIEENREGVEVKLNKGERIRAKYLIGADGAQSLVGKSFSLLPPKGNVNGVGIESEIPFESTFNFPAEERQLVHLDFGGVPNGYGWVFPKKEGLSIGVGGMFRDPEKVNLRQCFDSFIQGLNYVNAGKVDRVLAHPLPSFYDERQKVAKGRVLLVGDAAHLMDPLMGEGIYYALRSGKLAAEAILESHNRGLLPADVYQIKVQEQISQNLRWALQFSRFVFRFTSLAYRTLKRYQELADFYLQVLEGKETYQGFITRVKERMRDLLGGKLSERIKRAMAQV